MVRHLYARAFKRIFDVVLAVLMIGASLPVMILLAAAIAIEDPGPIFFRQRRVGRSGEVFMLLKLRTMSASGPAILDELFRSNPAARRRYEQTGVIADDPRVTSRAAGFARKYFFDELPQIFNILRGDMSFVGPRPLEYWLAGAIMSEREMALRTAVRPGLTGLAQVRRRSKADVGRRMVHLDLLYARRLSPGLDLGVLLATPRIILMGAGLETLSPAMPDHRPETEALP